LHAPQRHRDRHIFTNPPLSDQTPLHKLCALTLPRQFAPAAFDTAALSCRFSPMANGAAQEARAGGKELPMSRLARDFSWHLCALVMVIAGLGILAPLAWWDAGQALSRSEDGGRRSDIGSRTATAQALGRPRQRFHIQDDPVVEPPTDAPADLLLVPIEISPPAQPEPQVAPLAPLIADQIDLDPSVTETPALPVRASLTDDPLTEEATGDLRLSATLNRPTRIDLPDPQETVEPLRQPGDRDPSPFANPQLGPLQTHAWPLATSLIAQLQALAETTPEARDLAERAIQELQAIANAPALADPAVVQRFESLRRAAEEAKRIAASLATRQEQSPVLRAGYAIIRRIVIWDQVRAIAAGSRLTSLPNSAPAWNEAIGKVNEILGTTGAGANWRRYLLIDQAQRDFGSPERSTLEQQQLARDILHRMHSTQLSRDQENFLKTPPLAALREALYAQAAIVPDLPALLTAIEQHEQNRGSLAAKELAREYDVLRWSKEPATCELAATVNAYYRNANIRVALSSDLVNRMLPGQTAQSELVEDTILGAWVSGQSHTNTNVRLALIPDEHRWNLGLEAVGQVASDTSSSKGPATFYQNGLSMFRARKRLTVDRRGIRLFNAEAEANANNNLDDFETDFDGIPLLGGLVRAIARKQYDSSQPAAKVEVEGKIIVRATSQLDREVTQKIEQAKQDFQVKIVKPLQDLNLEPTAVDMETTAERLIARYRVAARDELSAHTPRPQAPGDSMLSAQIHESALNNVLEALNLQSRKVELSELYKEMSSRFARTRDIQVPEDLPENVYVTFADEDPVRVSCNDGLVRLTIRLRELVQEGTRNRWTNFTVQAYYEPSADQLDANLRRVGIIELIGDNRPLPVGQRVLLSGIFNRVLSKSRKLQVINRQISESPQLRDQQVTQFVIHDGWIGVALGPKAPGREAKMHPRKQLTELD
jgi:hypothetical protein